MIMQTPAANLLSGAASIAASGPVGAAVHGAGSVLNVAVNAAGHVVTNRKLNAIQETLSSVLQVSQVAAAASVLNLGVSVAGFAYMGYKLNQIQRSMSSMQEHMQAGFGRVDAKLDAIAGQLSYLLLLAESSSSEQRKISDSLAELHRAVLVSELAELQSWLDQLSRFPDDSPKEAIRAANKVRRTLSDQALRATPEFEPRVMLVADISIRGWIIATATEANLLMSMGQHRDARQLIQSEHPRFAKLAAHWADVLIANKRPHLQTALRFEAPRFRPFIMPERVERLAHLHRADHELSDSRRSRVAKEAALELEMSYNAALGDDWTRRQIAVAEYLDGLSELSCRLETLGAFARECEVRNLSSSRALLPGPETKPGIYVLSAIADDE